MNCKEAKNLIPVYLDDALDAADRQRVADHLRACDECRAESRAIEKSWELLGEVKAIEPDPNYRIRFWQAVDEPLPWHVRIRQAVQAVFLQQRWAPAAAVAAVVFVISAVAVQQFVRKPQLPADLAALSGAELEMVANIELAEDFEIIENIDFFSDLDIIEKMNGPQAS